MTLDRDNSAMRLYKPQDHRQPQASAGEFGGKKRRENLLEIFFGNAAAVVPYFQTGIGAISGCQLIG